VRLFFAVFPDSETRSRLAAAAQALVLDTESRKVPSENYHMTLAFIGEVSAPLAAFEAVGAAQRIPAFTARFDGYEYWPAPSVVVARASSYPAPLEDLRRGLCADLAQCGVRLDDRPFRPHVTIARKVPQAPVLQAMSEIAWTAHSFQLARSDRSRAGAVYTVVDSWSLLDKERVRDKTP
jgi:RNA 2',3'-cyclic 3'-phosphodiesterase